VKKSPKGWETRGKGKGEQFFGKEAGSKSGSTRNLVLSLRFVMTNSLELPVRRMHKSGWGKLFLSKGKPENGQRETREG